MVEIWSRTTGDYDYDITAKLPSYRERGDAEIWLIHPYERTLTAWRRQPDGSYAEETYRGGVVDSETAIWSISSRRHSRLPHMTRCDRGLAQSMLREIEGYHGARITCPPAGEVRAPGCPCQPKSVETAIWKQWNVQAGYVSKGDLLMVDQLLGGLFGSQDDDDEPTRQGRARDFVDRYERGAYDQIGDDEVLQNYRATASRLSPDEYQLAAAEAMRRMSPEQRRELRRELRRRSRDRFDASDDSPEEIARAMQRADQEDQGGGGLAGLFGLGGSDTPGNQSQGGGLQGVLDNPIAKVAMAGVAAMAAKKLTDPNR